MNALTLVTRAFFNQVWAVTPEMYGVIENIVLERLDGHKPDASEIESRVEGTTYGSLGAAAADATQGTEISVINLHGVLMSRIQAMERLSGGNTPQRFAARVRDAADDPAVGVIVLSIDSPGGSVAGIGVAGEAVAYAASKKRTIAVVDDSAYSAAYWLASQASEIVIPESGGVGSISVIMAHLDRRDQYAKAGIKPTVLRSGANKALGQEVEALTPAVRDKLLADMQQWHDLFVGAVARGRGKTPEFVQANWADGRTWLGAAAVEAGLADRLGSLASVLAELQEVPADPQAPADDEPDTIVVVAAEQPTSLAPPEPAAPAATVQSPALEVPTSQTDPQPDASHDTPQEGPHMNMSAITAKLAAGQPLSAEERAFLDKHLDGQAVTPPAADMSSWPAEARAAVEAATAQATQANARAEEAAKIAATERDTRLDREYREKALALGQPAEFGATLRTLHESNPDAATAVEDRLKAAHAQTRLMGEIGGVGSRPGAADPQARIEARAKELQATGMSADKALEVAMSESTDASAAYSQEVRA